LAEEEQNFHLAKGVGSILTTKWCFEPASMETTVPFRAS
jgi:hypothetical protein